MAKATGPVDFTAQAADMTLEILGAVAQTITSGCKATNALCKSTENVALMAQAGSDKMLVSYVETIDPVTITKAREIRETMGA